MSSLILVFLSVFAVLAKNVVQGESSNTSRLVNDLLRDEDVNVRPNADLVGSPTVVTVGLAFFGIEKTHDKHDTLTAHGYMSLQWSNPRLAWDPAHYGNISVVRLPIKSLWLPDITLFNSAFATEPIASPEQKLAYVTSDGTTLWVPKTQLSFAYNKTESNGTDTLTGKLLLGSWVYSNKDLDVQPKSQEVENYLYESKDFVMVNSSIEHNKIQYPCCPNEDYPRLEVNVVLQQED